MSSRRIYTGIFIWRTTFFSLKPLSWRRHSATDRGKEAARCPPLFLACGIITTYSNNRQSQQGGGIHTTSFYMQFTCNIHAIFTPVTSLRMHLLLYLCPIKRRSYESNTERNSSDHRQRTLSATS